jgi:Mrp family chromosome partitioning ATPase
MGRVYNALVRAERFDDRRRPIGSPDAREAGAVETDSFEFEEKLAFAEEVAKPLNRRPSVATGSALNAAALAPLSRRAVPSSPRPAFESPAASQPPPAAFEEPSEVLSVDRLKVDHHLGSVTGSDKRASERYRTLAVNVLNQIQSRKLKTVLVASAEGAEGRTTIAINIAWSLAQKFLAQKPRRRVLLIDATRSFDVSRMLGINPKRGWLDLMERSCDTKQAMVRIDPSGLYVMASGAYSAEQFTDGFASRLENVIADMTSLFDVIVVDSHPILDSSETQCLAGVLDATVIVARAGCTHHSKVTAARKLVPKARRLGVVLNESDADASKLNKSSFVSKLFGGTRRSA